MEKVKSNLFNKSADPVYETILNDSFRNQSDPVLDFKLFDSLKDLFTGTYLRRLRK